MSVAAKFKFVSKSQHLANTRHVYRALLRECSYLPDSAAQRHIARYVRHRFDNGRERASLALRQLESRPCEGSHDKSTLTLEESLRKAYRGLHQLIRANDGELRPLKRILRYTYGRSGPRRYEMLRTLLAPDISLNEHAAENGNRKSAPEDSMNGSVSTNTSRQTINKSPPPSSKQTPTHFFSVVVPAALELQPDLAGQNLQYTIKRNYSRLDAIVSSQFARNVEGRHRPRPSNKISIPARNSWKRHMPVKRVKNMVADKWARVLDAILPPLPQKEWNRLRDLSLGTLRWEASKTRRARPAGAPANLTATDLEKLAHLSDDVGEAVYLDQYVKDPGMSKTQKILELSKDSGYWTSHDTWLASATFVDDALDRVLDDELLVRTLNKHVAGKERGHRITERLMRRLWMEVWKECPLLLPEEDPSGDATARHAFRWKVVWGQAPKMLRRYEEYEDDGLVNELFGGGAPPQIKEAKREMARMS